MNKSSAKCSACNTPLSREGGSEGLCPGCLLELALDDTSFEAEVLQDPEEALTLQYSGYTFEEGQIQGERYRVRSLLGRGGMGEVWRAYDLKLRQDVALKALHTELIEDTDALETLRQEVRTAREVISPNVCRVFDLQELDGQELVSMEYVDGTTLQEILKERSPLDLDEAREIASQFLAGLEAIHEAGLIHRDIKPENVMVTRTGRVVVMDFGIAKGLGDGKGGLIAGTPAYMSPEQSQGDELDTRADVFSAGVVLAEMVVPAGVRSLEDRQRVWEAIHQEAPEIAETPWSRVISQCIAADREARYTTASELARALEEVTLRAVGDDTARPYPGLSAFQEEDAEYFYGRELEVEALWKKLRRPHLLAVIGPSGAGKSSFLRAGLLPTLTDGWRALIATPGNRPFSNLAQALAPQLGEAPGVAKLLQRFEEPDIAIELCSQWRQQSKHSLIILDQFEELFTQNPEAVQASFAELLGRLPLEADLFVLLSMRDDFVMHCHRFEALRPIFSELSPLDPPLGSALRRALVEPALRCGYRFEDESIVEEMLSEVEGQRGALPLLAFAAAQLWERRDRETGLLTRKSYELIGGVGGALAQHAEAILDYIGEGNVPIVRELFRNLVTAQGTRAARDREEVLAVFPETEGEPFREPSQVKPTPTPRPQRPAAKHVLISLIDARLLTSYEVPADEEGSEPHHRIEIVHESLLARWPRLVRWQRQDADSAQMRDELRHQSRLWDEKSRPEDMLWTGTAFKEYEIWRERYPGGLTQTEEAFGDAMVHQAERQKRRRRIAISAAFGILLVILGVIAWFGWRAELERRRAEAGKLVVLGELELDSYPTATLAWATRSIEVSDTREGRLLALQALQEGPPVRVTSPETTWNIALSPSGEWLAQAALREIYLQRQDGSEPIHLGSFASPNPLRIAFQDDDALIVDAGGDIRWLSVPDGEVFRRAEGNRGRLSWPRADGYFSFSEAEGQGSIFWWPFEDSDGRLVGSMENWRVLYSDGATWESAEWEADWSAIDIDPSGAELAYSDGQTVYLRSIEDWSRSPLRLGEHTSAVVEVAVHPDGKRVAARDQSGAVEIWSSLGKPTESLRSFKALGLKDIRFDPTGNWLAAHGVVDGIVTTRLWNLAAPKGAEPLTLKRTDAYFTNSLAFHPHKPWLITGNTNNIGVWPLAARFPWVQSQGDRVDAVAFTPDGEWLLTAAGDGIRAWPLQGQNHGASRILLDRPLVAFTTLAIHPSGEYLAVGSREGTVVLVPLNGGQIRDLPGRWNVEGLGMIVAFSPDGRHLAAVPYRTVENDVVIRVWNLEAGETRALEWNPGDYELSTILVFDDDRNLRWRGRGSEVGEKVFNIEDGSATEVPAVDGFSEEGAASNDGSFLLIVRSASADLSAAEVVWRSLETGKSRVIHSHGAWPATVATDSTDQLLVTGDFEGTIRVGPITGEEPHLLFGHRGIVRSIAVSPDGRWIASGGDDGTVRLWPMPELSEPPIHTLPHDELIAKLHTLTNLRIVEDPESPSGWKIDYGPFPGWKEVPEW
jgi:serine/threonine protein kinase/WD40 repeat protein